MPRRSLVLRIVLLTVAPLIGLWLWSAGSVLAASRRDEARPAEAIVVLGAAQYVGRPSPVLRARIDHAIGLWQRGFAPRIVFTGGAGDGDTTSEAAVSRTYALKHGVPDSAILLESHGRTTRESMRAVAALMRERGLRSVILVSDPFHMRRLAVLARLNDLEPYGSPTTTSPISASPTRQWKYMLNESLKVPLSFIIEREYR
ncbi:MAG: YdcF family protein [Gemmatimonadaceae bacterium]